MKNNSFCHNYKLNDSIPKYNNKKKQKNLFLTIQKLKKQNKD